MIDSECEYYVEWVSIEDGWRLCECECVPLARAGGASQNSKAGHDQQSQGDCASESDARPGEGRGRGCAASAGKIARDLRKDEADQHGDGDKQGFYGKGRNVLGVTFRPR